MKKPAPRPEPKNKFALRDPISRKFLAKSDTKFWLAEGEGTTWVRKHVALETLDKYTFQQAFDPGDLPATLDLVELTYVVHEHITPIHNDRVKRLGRVMAKAFEKRATRFAPFRRSTLPEPLKAHTVFLEDVEERNFAYEYSMILKKVMDPPTFHADFRIATMHNKLHLAFRWEKDLMLARMYYAGQIEWMFDYATEQVWMP